MNKIFQINFEHLYSMKCEKFEICYDTYTDESYPGEEFVKSIIVINVKEPIIHEAPRYWPAKKVRNLIQKFYPEARITEVIGGN